MAFGYFGNEQYNLGPGSELTLIDSPDDIAGLDLWFKSDVGVTGTTDITAWADQSGNSNDLSIFGTGTNVSILDIGGTDFVFFDGITGKFLGRSVLSANAQVDGVDKAHVFIVANNTTSSSAVAACWNRDGAGQVACCCRIRGSAGLILNVTGGGVTLTTGGAEDETVIAEYRVDYTLGTTEEMRVTVNDFETLNDAVGGITSAFDTLGETDFFLGSEFGPTGGNTDDIAIAEVIAYVGQVLTSEERTAVLNYLASKYSITLGA